MNLAKTDKLVRMANQIGAAFGAVPESEATANVARHLQLYWTPKMISEIIAFAELGQYRPQYGRGQGGERVERRRPGIDRRLRKKPAA